MARVLLSSLHWAAFGGIRQAFDTLQPAGNFSLVAWPEVVTDQALLAEAMALQGELNGAPTHAGLNPWPDLVLWRVSVSSAGAASRPHVDEYTPASMPGVAPRENSTSTDRVVASSKWIRPTPPCPTNWWEGTGVCYQGCPSNYQGRNPATGRCLCGQATGYNKGCIDPAMKCINGECVGKYTRGHGSVHYEAVVPTPASPHPRIPAAA